MKLPIIAVPPETSFRTRLFAGWFATALVLLATGNGSLAQTFNCGAGTAAPSASLACLVQVSLTPQGQGVVPSRTRQAFGLTNSLDFLSGDIGAEVSQIPLASPASGIIYAIDPITQLPRPVDQSLGPILTQRAQTIGRYKIYIATTYQYFLLQDIDSVALKSLPAIIFLNSQGNSQATPDIIGNANNFLQLKVHQFVGYFTLGLTSRIDVSVAVPLLRVDLRDTFAETFSGNGVPAPKFSGPNTRAGEATGIGDIIVAGKWNAWKLRRGERVHGGLSFGAEFRVPSGDARNYLGSGAIGVKPFATFTYASHISPHFNIGYQWNGKSELIAVQNAAGAITEGNLPNRLIYSGGVDFVLLKRLTINADIIAQHIFDAQRATLLPAGQVVFGNVVTTAPIVQPVTASYTRLDGTGGLKWNPFRGLLLTGNVTVKLNQAGLRSRVVPLMGASYTF